MIPTMLILAAIVTATPRLPDDPTLYLTETGWCVLDTLPDGTGLVVEGGWGDMLLLRAALAQDPKPSPVAECTAAALATCGAGNVCDVTVKLDECTFHCRDGHGNCPPVVLPTPAPPPGTQPTKPPSTPAN